MTFDQLWRLAVIAAVFLVLWLAHSVWKPETTCVKCKGSPRYRSFSGRSWRNCFLCGGSGKRIRLGAKWLRAATGRKK